MIFDERIFLLFSFKAQFNFSYDANRGMVGMKGVSYNVPDEQQTKLWIIENIKTGQIYTINLDTKQCDKSTDSIQPMDCIPGMIYLTDFPYEYFPFFFRKFNLY
jgi:hypothetical protein